MDWKLGNWHAKGGGVEPEYRLVWDGSGMATVDGRGMATLAVRGMQFQVPPLVTAMFAGALGLDSRMMASSPRI